MYVPLTNQGLFFYLSINRLVPINADVKVGTPGLSPAQLFWKVKIQTEWKYIQMLLEESPLTLWLKRLFMQRPTSTLCWLRWWLRWCKKKKKKSQPINNSGLWSIRKQDAHQLSTSHFGFFRELHLCPRPSFTAAEATRRSPLHHISEHQHETSQWNTYSEHILFTSEAERKW